jgi:hypothetical protein
MDNLSECTMIKNTIYEKNIVLLLPLKCYLLYGQYAVFISYVQCKTSLETQWWPLLCCTHFAGLHRRMQCECVVSFPFFLCECVVSFPSFLMMNLRSTKPSSSSQHTNIIKIVKIVLHNVELDIISAKFYYNHCALWHCECANYYIYWSVIIVQKYSSYKSNIQIRIRIILCMEGFQIWNL